MISGVDRLVAGSEALSGVWGSLIGGGGDEEGGGGLARWEGVAVEVVGGGDVATLGEGPLSSVTSSFRRGIVGVGGMRGDCEASGTNMTGEVKRPSWGGGGGRGSAGLTAGTCSSSAATSGASSLATASRQNRY